MSIQNTTTVTVCDACGSDMCWQGNIFCENYRAAGTKEAPACQHRSDRTGQSCLRPEIVHTSGWSHVFTGDFEPCGFGLGDCSRPRNHAFHDGHGRECKPDHEPHLSCHKFRPHYCNGCDMDARQGIERPHTEWCGKYQHREPPPQLVKGWR